MDTHASYHSALHALNLAVQVHHDLAFALRLTEVLWEIYPPPELTPGEVLYHMLKEAGIGAQLIGVEPRELRAVLCSSLLRKRLAFFALHIGPREADIRWAVVTGWVAKQITFAVCLQPGDFIAHGEGIIDHATGQVVVLHDVYDDPTVIGRDGAAHLQRDPSAN